ncbi:ribonuclease HII [Chromatocurvus halotolerans]|uniref:Ribonuclease HII n=1 Tax=Chromatocurvus halotolerans TaxID=1132028 RepID=A0A4R2KP07_9GAMM|nr:ribonuclease HII [Chromatocurvus halotolerans]TCO75911.1 RNase HII [Chromatocurvus halotolerans]
MDDLRAAGFSADAISARYLAGVDEVGRGPLAGDVVAAAVILDPGRPIPGLADSKTLSQRRREQLADQIREQSLGWALGRASVAEIDTINILQASLQAMHRAVAALAIVPDLVLVDGNRLPQWPYRAQAVIKGDSRCAAIAAASILAKVQRDAELVALEQRFPGYGFAQHKGYPTAAHLEALVRLGPTVVHRRSFAPVRRIIAAGETVSARKE